MWRISPKVILVGRSAISATVKRERDRAHDAAEQAAWKMARTRPTTIAGAAALLAYITTGPITGLLTLGETSWHETAFYTVIAALAEIARTIT